MLFAVLPLETNDASNGNGLSVFNLGTSVIQGAEISPLSSITVDNKGSDAVRAEETALDPGLTVYNLASSTFSTGEFAPSFALTVDNLGSLRQQWVGTGLSVQNGPKSTVENGIWNKFE